MTFQTSTVTIVSTNPAYPNNKITLTVDNDLNPSSTIVIKNTTFPYIIEFTNHSESVGKRYISDYLYKRLLNAYSTDRGKIYNTLQKGFCPYPYITLDYDLIDKQIKEEKSISITERGETIPILNYVGANIDDANTLNPEQILNWLDLPLINETGEAIKSFPFLLSYQNKTDLRVNVELVKRKREDFFATTYFTSIDYPLENVSKSDSKQEYDNYISGQTEDYLSGEKSNSKKFNKLLSNSKIKSLDNILSNVGKIKRSIFGIAGLALAASSVKNKLDSLKNVASAVKFPKKPAIGFNKILVTAKIKKAEQKPKKKKRLSGKKAKPLNEAPTLKNPAVEALKAQAGSLTTLTATAKNAALAQQQAITQKISNPISTGVNYIITTSVSGDTIVVNVANNFGFPSFSQQYSAVTFTQETAKDNIKFQLDNFGYFDSVNGSYPKTGSPIPS